MVLWWNRGVLSTRDGYGQQELSEYTDFIPLAPLAPAGDGLPFPPPQFNWRAITGQDGKPAIVARDGDCGYLVVDENGSINQWGSSDFDSEFPDACLKSFPHPSEPSLPLPAEPDATGAVKATLDAEALVCAVLNRIGNLHYFADATTREREIIVAKHVAALRGKGVGNG